MSTRKAAADAAANRLQDARKKAAEALGLDVTDWRSRRYGMLSIALTNLENALADGHRIDIRQLVEIETAMQEIVASLPKEPIKVTIEMVDSDTTTPLDWSPKPATAPIDTAVQPAEIETPASVEAVASTAAPVVPPSPPISETMAAWNRHCGYNRSARDGGLIKGAAVPHSDPNLTPARRVVEDYVNDKPSCWTGYQGRQNGGAQPDPNPSFHSDGSVRKPYEPPH